MDTWAVGHRVLSEYTKDVLIGSSRAVLTFVPLPK